MFAAEGGKVICASRTARDGDNPLPGSAETIVGEIRVAGGEATGVVCQVSRPDECERLLRETHKTYGPLDVLINNAAVTSPWDLPLKDFPPTTG